MNRVERCWASCVTLTLFYLFPQQDYRWLFWCSGEIDRGRLEIFICYLSRLVISTRNFSMLLVIHFSIFFFIYIEKSISCKLLAHRSCLSQRNPALCCWIAGFWSFRFSISIVECQLLIFWQYSKLHARYKALSVSLFSLSLSRFMVCWRIQNKPQLTR